MSSLERQRPVMTPSSLNAMARDLLEGAFPLVWVEGELSGVSRPASGHVYFSLKDARAQLRCALFKPRSQRLSFVPGDGQQVLVRGRLSLYEPRGDYQLIAEHLEPAGEGALRRAFEALRAQLESEGLFEASRKRAVPVPPHRLGVVTSASGAAIRDVLSVLGRRFPLLEVDVLPVLVQGREAPPQIISMLRKADASGRYDALLLTRGGGSLEDLFAFNDEALARCIAELRTPLVSAVGHEIDFSISDFVADQRAPTPSAAAELLVPDRIDLMARLQNLRARSERCWRHERSRLAQRLDHLELRLRAQAPASRLLRMRERLSTAQLELQSAQAVALRGRREQLAALARRLKLASPALRLALQRPRAQQLALRLRRAVDHAVRRCDQRSQAIARTLDAVSPLRTLGRGYSILFVAESGELVHSVGQVQTGLRMKARLADGEFGLVAD